MACGMVVAAQNLQEIYPVNEPIPMFLAILAPYVGIVIGTAFLFGVTRFVTSVLPDLRPKARTASMKELKRMSDFTVLVSTPDLIRILVEPYVPLLASPDLLDNMQRELCDSRTHPLKMNVLILDMAAEEEPPNVSWTGEYTILVTPRDSHQFDESQIQAVLQWASNIIREYIKQGNESVGVTKASDFVDLVEQELNGEDDLPPDPHVPSNLH